MTRKNYPAKFKAKVALEAIKGEKSLSELSSEYQIHANLISKWKKYFLEHMEEIFESPSKKKKDEAEMSNDELYRQIGQQKVEIEWLKKSLDYSVEKKRSMIELENIDISMSRQCELVNLSKSSFYYQSKDESVFNYDLMKNIDHEYTDKPYYGVNRITAALRKKRYTVKCKENKAFNP